MINKLQSLFYRPEKGWDPINSDQACQYSELARQQLNYTLLDQIDDWLGGIAGKRVLDLGGGPGHYSVAFAQRGAEVVWHDISHIYREIAMENAIQADVEINFSVGYLEEARRYQHMPFDLVFNRGCWYYCMNDKAFAKLIYALVAPTGAAYIDAPIEQHARSLKRKVLAGFNRHWGLKLNHLNPPHGRVAGLFNQYPIDYMFVDYQRGGNNKVFFKKPGLNNIEPVKHEIAEAVLKAA
jgi:2-polyprenyl-3-methyl-5-hydroxy-6-metoxy-1,4-benzoquinol methylase